MEGDPQPAQSPASEASASAPAAAPESASGYMTWQDRLDRAFGNLPADPPADASNGGTAAPPKPETEEDDDEDDEPTPQQEGAKSSETKPGEGKADPAQPPEAGDKPLSRRQQREQENRERIAALEAERDAIAERTRAEVRAELEREREATATREQQEALARSNQADVERFERLNALPDDDPILAEGDNYAWLQERKRLLRAFPDVERHYQTAAERAVAERQAAIDADVQAREAAFWNGVRSDLASAKDVPGVDFEAVKKAATFAERDRLMHAAGAATKEAEYRPQIEAKDAEIAKHLERIAELEADVNDLRLVGPRGLGSTRAPVTGGASGDSTANPRRFDERRSSRDNLVAAIGI